MITHSKLLSLSGILNNRFMGKMMDQQEFPGGISFSDFRFSGILNNRFMGKMMQAII